MVKLCECGCGEIVKPGNRFINGHGRRGIKLNDNIKRNISLALLKFYEENPEGKKSKAEPKLCECGCGELAKSGSRFIRGHHTRCMSEDTKIKLSEINKGKILSDKTRQKMSVSGRGRIFTETHKENLSKAAKEKPPVTTKTKVKLSEINKGKNNPNYGLKRSDKSRQKMSASIRGIPYDEWESFACDQPYCPLFNEKCKESNRDKYDRRCFLTGLPEEENITKNGKIYKLSVHHVDMDKMQGCDGKRWKLVPVCLQWHRKVHNELWEARIIWLLDNVWGDYDTN